jgi:hypothetical protein
MSDETSSGVDVAKLCARENPLVHYYRVAARGVLPLLSFGLLAAGTLGFQAFVLLQISEAPSGRAYGEDASSIFVGDLVAGRITTMLFCIWTVLLVTAFQSLVFRILGRDPRRDEGIVHLVLTPLTSNQILWGSIRTPLLVSLIVVGTTLAMTVVKLEIMFDLISSWRTIIRTSTLDLILAFFIVTMFSTYLNVKGYVIGGVQGALLSLAAPFASIPIFILGMSYILNSANSPMRMMLGIFDHGQCPKPLHPSDARSSRSSPCRAEGDSW